MRGLKLALIGTLVLAFAVTPLIAEVIIYDYYYPLLDRGVCLVQLNDTQFEQIVYRDANGEPGLQQGEDYILSRMTLTIPQQNPDTCWVPPCRQGF